MPRSFFAKIEYGSDDFHLCQNDTADCNRTINNRNGGATEN